MNFAGRVLLSTDSPMRAGDSEMELMNMGADLCSCVKLIFSDSAANSM
jgi:hypothetical protein